MAMARERFSTQKLVIAGAAVVGLLAPWGPGAPIARAAEAPGAQAAPGPQAVSGMPATRTLVAAGHALAAGAGAVWGRPTTGGPYSYPEGVSGVGADDTGAGDRGLLRMAAGRTARTELDSLEQRDVSIDTTFLLERIGAPTGTLTCGDGIRYAIEARKVGGDYYRAAVRVAAESKTPTGRTRGAATVSIERIDEADVTRSRTLATASLGTLRADDALRLQFEVDGSDIPTLRARVFAADASAPQWQLSTSDNGSDRLRAAGSIAFSGYTAPDTATSQVRIRALTVHALADGMAESSGYGAPSLGTTSYPVPADPNKIIWVNPRAPRTADDWAPGQYVIDANHREASAAASNPVRKLPLAPNRTTATLAGAIRQANNGDTIIMKAGTYHEQITVMKNAAITIQPENGAKVWLDGSTVVTGWAASGGLWAANWYQVFSPVYPTGEWTTSDGTALGWRYVNSAYPMAARPDQVFLDGQQLDQAASKAQVTASSFWFDEANRRLYLGTNPAGHEVRASDLQFALRAATPIAVRGIGMRNYATWMPQRAVVNVQGPRNNGLAFATSSFTDVIVQDGAAGGFQVSKPGTTLTNVTARYHGNLGIAASVAGGLSFTNVAANHNNTEWFNRAPSAGGTKIAHDVNGLTIKGGDFSDNQGPGLWLDENVTNFSVASVNADRNSEVGILVELSTNGSVVNSVVRDNRYVPGVGAPHNQGNADQPDDIGIFVFDSSNVRVWNNTVTGSYKALAVRQDGRTWQGRTWPTTGVVARNNILAGASTSANPWCAGVCVYDDTRAVTSPTMVPSIAGNAYHRTSTSAPPALLRWEKQPGSRTQYASLAAAGIDGRGREFTGAVPVQANGRATAALQNQAGAAGFGTPVDAAIAALTAGTRAPLTAGSYLIGAVR